MCVQWGALSVISRKENLRISWRNVVKSFFNAGLSGLSESSSLSATSEKAILKLPPKTSREGGNLDSFKRRTFKKANLGSVRKIRVALC